MRDKVDFNNLIRFNIKDIEIHMKNTSIQLQFDLFLLHHIFIVNIYTYTLSHYLLLPCR